MTKKNYFFISYSHIESEFALKLAADLKNAGIAIWMDRLESGIQTGDAWSIVLEKAVNDSSGLIAILSPEYVNSRYCRNELARADILRKPVLPILLHRVPDADWPLEIQRSQYVNFENWRDEAYYQTTFTQLLNRIQELNIYTIDDIPDTESQYLTSLIAELETRKGVLEYVQLTGQLERQESHSERPNPTQEEWATGLSLFLTRKSTVTKQVSRESRERISDIQSAIEQFPRLVLTGDAGAGKTTTMRRIALDMARKRQRNPYSTPLPVLLYLPAWNTDESMQAFIQRHWPFQSDAMSALQQGVVHLFLDGLNEMGQRTVENAVKLRRWLHDFRPPRRILITSRTDDYAGELDMNLPVVTIEAMQDRHIQQFVRNYLGSRSEHFLSQLFPEKKKSPERDKTVELVDPVPQRQLLKLARNPYLLTALIFVYDNVEMGQLPQNTGSLSRGLVSALWERERIRNTPGWMDVEHMEKYFSELAFSIIDEDRPVDVPREYVVSKIEKTSLLDAGLRAHFIEERYEQIRFYHQLIQEYFAAVKLKEQGYRSYVEPMNLILGRRLAGKWDQVLIALCGLVLDASDIVAFIAQHDIYLASQCVASGAAVRKEIIDHIVIDLLTSLTSSDNRSRKIAEQCFLMLDTDAVSGLLLGLEQSDDLDGAVQRVVQLLDDNTALPELIIKLDDPEAIKRLGRIHSSFVHALLVELFYQSNSSVMEYVIKALDKRNWLPEDERDKVKFYIFQRQWGRLITLGSVAIPALIEIIQNRDTKSHLASTWAMMALGVINEPDAVPALVECLQDDNLTRRSNAVKALAKIQYLSAERALFEATVDNHPVIRLQAVYALQERNWKPENKDQAIKIHTTLVRSKDRTERQQALKFLVAEENFVPDEQLASYLLKLFHRGDVSEKSSVTHLLARTRASNYLSAYLKLLSQDNLDKSLESAVRLAIKKIPGKPLVRELRKRLLSGELEQRSTIAHLLQELGWEPRHPIETLIYNLSVHKYEQVRTLLQKKPALLVEYSSRFESEHIQELLEKIDLYYSPQLVNSLVKLSEHPDRIVRLKLVDIFKIHLREQGIEGLLYLLNNDDLKVRRASKHALLSPEVPASMVIDRLQRHRGSKRQKVILCDVLGEKRAEEAVLILMALASSKDFHIAKSAVTALGKIGDGRAVPILQKVLYQDGRIWKTILYALKNIGTQEALSVIAKYRKYR